ncbi:hypothetical protein Tco_1487080 [Tanacetum coccineum]
MGVPGPPGTPPDSVPDSFSQIFHNLLQEQEDLDRYYSMDITQKSKIQWDVEGDENTNFFHGILNQKRRHQLVQGIMVNGEWISNPIQVKKAFFNFFHDKFQPTESSFDANSNPGFTTLCPNIALDLQNPASFEEKCSSDFNNISSKRIGNYLKMML